jgi:chromosome segregation ATPase
LNFIKIDSMSTDNIRIDSKQASPADPELNNLVVKLWELVRNASEGITDLRSKYAELDSKYRNAERSLTDRNNYHEKSEQKLNSLEKKVEELNSQLFAKDNHIQMLSESAKEITELKAKLAEMESNLSQVTQKNTLLKEKAAFLPKLTDELEAERLANRKNELALIEMNNKIKELTSLNASFSIVQKELAHKNFVIKEKSEKIEQLKEQLEINKSKVINLKNIESERNDYAEKLGKLEEEYRLLRNRQSEDLQMLTVEIEDKNNNIRELGSKLQEAENLIDQLRNSGNNKDVLLKKLGDNTSVSESKLSSLQSIIETNIADINKLKSKNAELARMLSVLKEQQQLNLMKDRHNAELVQKIEETEAAMVLLQKERDRLKKLNQGMGDDLERTRASLNEKLDVIDELTKEAEALRGQLQSQADSDEIEQSISENEAKIEENDAKIEEYESKIEELKSVISKMSEQIIHSNTIEKRFSELNEKLNKATNELTVKDISLTQSREQVDELEKLLKKRYEQITILESELNEIYDKANSNKAKFAGLTNKIDNYIMQIDEFLK